MRRLSARFTKIILIGFLTYAALPAQEIGKQPRVIADGKLSACIDHLAKNMVHDGSANVPFTMKIEASGEDASGRQPRTIADPVTAACVDLLAQQFLRDGVATIPFAIKTTPER